MVNVHQERYSRLIEEEKWLKNATRVYVAVANSDPAFNSKVFLDAYWEVFKENSKDLVGPRTDLTAMKEVSFLLLHVSHFSLIFRHLSDDLTIH